MRTPTADQGPAALREIAATCVPPLVIVNARLAAARYASPGRCAPAPVGASERLGRPALSDKRLLLIVGVLGAVIIDPALIASSARMNRDLDRRQRELFRNSGCDRAA